ncbi:TolC family protein [Pontixanthobacter aquaemixtae]|uniref:TolC family protein n=1 Tax=Pontixanthobacter aquaemixtae TaxID=1958940 RepID=UPI0013716947|nr:TolC family protein [Pontixanthobacter aquaemixtae]
MTLATPAIPQTIDETPAEPVAKEAATYGPPADETAAIVPITPIAIPKPLDRAAALASQTHPLVESAEAEADALAAEYRGAKWQRYPNISVEALAATSGSALADEDGLALNLALEQPIWSGGRISGEIARARATMRSGEDRVDEAQRQIVLDVISAYYGYVQADERFAVLQESLRQHQELLAAIGRRVDQEVSPLADLTLGRSRTAQVEIDLALNEETRESARIRLYELTGGVAIDPAIPPPGVEELLPSEEVALIEAMACDPTLAALTSQITAAEAQRDIAKAQLLPQLLLQLSQNEITGARAAFVLRMQLGNGGAQLAAIDSTDARVTRALAEFGQAHRRVREELRRDYVLLKAAKARLAAGTQATGAADDIVGSYRRQFIAGRRSWLDVMNAVREAASARLSESDARVLAATATARIYARTCRWQPSGADTGQ